MINLQALIEASKAALEELKNGTHEIITRSTPATWEDLREDLEEKLVPILKRLYDQIGGLMQQPEVILPDGVTSTSLVSQSEMTQFVTNTLNTWLLDLEDRIEKVKNMSFFSLIPSVVAYKYKPAERAVMLPVGDLLFTPPELTYSKKVPEKIFINIPDVTFIEPTITIS